MEIIILAIIAVIGGFLLIKYYNNIDIALFGDKNPDYQPSGRWILWLSMITGAVFGAIFLYNQFADSNKDLDNVYYYTAVSLLITIIVIGLFNIVASQVQIGKTIGKCLFITLCSAVAFGVGVAAAFIVFIASIIYVITLLVSSANDSYEKGRLIKTQSGLLGEGGMTLRRLSGNIYVNDQGQRFRRDGNSVTEIPRDE